MSISAITNTAVANVASNAKSVSSTSSTDSFVPFKDLLQNAVQQVNETDSAVKNDQLAIATGETDALHTITIDAAKADLALQTFVQVRNKALDAYNEIMKMSL